MAARSRLRRLLCRLGVVGVLIAVGAPGVPGVTPARAQEPAPAVPALRDCPPDPPPPADDASAEVRWLAGLRADERASCLAQTDRLDRTRDLLSTKLDEVSGNAGSEHTGALRDVIAGKGADAEHPVYVRPPTDPEAGAVQTVALSHGDVQRLTDGAADARTAYWFAIGLGLAALIVPFVVRSWGVTR